MNTQMRAHTRTEETEEAETRTVVITHIAAAHPPNLPYICHSPTALREHQKVVHHFGPEWG